MSKYERGFHPLSKVEAQKIPGVTLALPLPTEINKDEIGVNVRRLQTMQRWGGIKQVNVNGWRGRRGDKSVSYTTEKVSSGSLPSILSHVATSLKADISLNIDNIAQSLTNKGTPPESTQAWVSPLDKALKETVAEIGISHVLNGMDSFLLTTAGVIDIAALNVVGMKYSLPSLLVNNAFVNIGTRGFVRMTQGKLEPNTHRWSLFYGPQFDRAAALALMEKTKVVKYLGDK